MKLNKANFSETSTACVDLDRSIENEVMPSKVYDKGLYFNLNIVILFSMKTLQKPRFME